MKKKNIYIFFDNIIKEYKNYFGEAGEAEAVGDLKNYLADLSKKSAIMIITKENISKTKEWFLKHDLLKFIENISNPAI